MIVFQAPVSHPVTPLKVVLLSGLSDPTTCALSPEQVRFLEALEVPESCKLYWNFPYIPCPEKARRAPPLWLASLRNTRQFLEASRLAYRSAARGHWQSLTASTDKLVVITLSCGLEILNQCLSGDGIGSRIHVFALGPVARRAPSVPCTLVRGARDLLSRCFFRTSDLVVPGVGHMDYLRNNKVLELLNEHLCGNTLPSRARDCTCPGGS